MLAFLLIATNKFFDREKHKEKQNLDSNFFLDDVFLLSANEVAERLCFQKRVSRILSIGGGVHPLWADTTTPGNPPPSGQTPPSQVDTGIHSCLPTISCRHD